MLTFIFEIETFLFNSKLMVFGYNWCSISCTFLYSVCSQSWELSNEISSTSSALWTEDKQMSDVKSKGKSHSKSWPLDVLCPPHHHVSTVSTYEWLKSTSFFLTLPPIWWEMLLWFKFYSQEENTTHVFITAIVFSKVITADITLPFITLQKSHVYRKLWFN